MSQKKKAEERNVVIIKELAHLPENRNCCECGQAGPTYVNLTVSSFCCSTCSGILRGLNPPHRVKSINMSTFTTEEVEKLRTGGNEACRKVWMSTYKGPTATNLKRNDMLDHLMKKYEKKEWYLAPGRQQPPPQNVVLTSPASQSSSTATSKSTPKPKVQEFDLLSDDWSPPSNVNALPNQCQTSNTLFNAMNDPRAFSPPSFTAPAPPPPVPLAPPNVLTSENATRREHHAAQAPPMCGHVIDNFFDDFEEKFKLAFSGRTNGDSMMPRSTTLPVMPPTAAPIVPNRVQPTQPVISPANQQLFQQQQWGAPKMPISQSVNSSLIHEVASNTPRSQPMAPESTAFYPGNVQAKGSQGHFGIRQTSFDPFFNVQMPQQPKAIASINPFQQTNGQSLPTNPVQTKPPVIPVAPIAAQDRNPFDVQQQQQQDKYSALAELDKTFHPDGLQPWAQPNNGLTHAIPAGVSPLSGNNFSDLRKSKTFDGIGAGLYQAQQHPPLPPRPAVGSIYLNGQAPLNINVSSQPTGIYNQTPDGQVRNQNRCSTAYSAPDQLGPATIWTRNSDFGCGLSRQGGGVPPSQSAASNSSWNPFV